MLAGRESGADNRESVAQRYPPTVVWYHIVMAKSKPKVNEIDTGGGTYPPGYGLGGFKKIVNEKADDIGYGVGQSYFKGKISEIKVPSGKPKIVTTRGDVYTPGGMYTGKDVFIQKPALTNQQITGVVQGQITKAGTAAAQISGAARTGAKIGIGVGGSAGLIVGYGGRDIVEGLKTVVNKIRESDKLPKPKAPKRR